MLTRMAPLLTRTARMARMLTRMTRWLAYYTHSGHIVVVVSPLVNLMRDQVRSLRSIGISSVSLSDLQEGEAEKVEKAAYSVVFDTPESWLKVERWRQVLSSPIYSEKLCCVAVDEAHVIKQW